MAGTLQSISVGGDNTFSMRAPTYVDTFALTTTPLYYPFAAGVTHALMSASGNFTASYMQSSVGTSVGSTVVTMPTTTPTTDGSGAELNPSMRQVKGYAGMGLIAGASCYFTVASFKP